ncbi:ATP-dependent zinc protease [Vibrio sp. S4M6]|uniref:ATP-dependent zinc protease family protein n=1 Tax=Vibrio sinus TaxID=2946865 RepID=UPI002029BD7E|nr:ATP-dependent zinc protease [Vibrio sinus]MCL9783188.1 ATP-dependent zinc protease [Vibrio sinus]
MKSTWKIIIVFIVSSTLFACANTQKASAPDKKPPPKPVDKVVNTPVKPQTKPAEQKPSKPKPVVKPKKTSDGKTILGSKEWVHIPGMEMNFKARVDTGATTSSISALDIVLFERDGKDWVKFTIVHDSVRSKEMSLPVERWAKVRQANSDKEDKRPVVISWVELGGLREKTEFTLTDRTHLEYPVILGRNFFKDIAIVDVGREYVQGKPKPKS